MASELWQRLRSARGAAGLKQQEIADSCGVSRVAVGHWESPDPGRRTRPSIATLQIIAKLTDAPMKWLVDDDADIHPDWGAGLEERKFSREAVPVPVIDFGKCELASMLHDNPDMSADEACRAAGVKPLAHVYMSNDMSSNVGVSHGNRLFMFMYDDDSMEPEVKKGDSVIVDVDAPLAGGDLVVIGSFDSPAKYIIRRLQVLEYVGDTVTFQLTPDNPRAATFRFDPAKLVDGDLHKTAVAIGKRLRGAPTFGRVIQIRRVYF